MFIELCMKGNSLPTLKGNNSCKTHNFRIKVINVKWSIGSLAILAFFNYNKICIFKCNMKGQFLPNLVPIHANGFGEN